MIHFFSNKNIYTFLYCHDILYCLILCFIVYIINYFSFFDTLVDLLMIVVYKCYIKGF